MMQKYNEDTQEMPPSGNTAYLRHQMEILGTNNDKTNGTYETTDAQTKKNYNRGTALELPLRKLLQGFTHAKKLALNSHAVPNYKYMLWLHTCPLPHL